MIYIYTRALCKHNALPYNRIWGVPNLVILVRIIANHRDRHFYHRGAQFGDYSNDYSQSQRWKLHMNTSHYIYMLWYGSMYYPPIIYIKLHTIQLVMLWRAMINEGIMKQQNAMSWCLADPRWHSWQACSYPHKSFRFLQH